MRINFLKRGTRSRLSILDIRGHLANQTSNDVAIRHGDKRDRGNVTANSLRARLIRVTFQ